MDAEIRVILGQRLKQERERLALSQAVMAEYGATKARTYQDWERGLASVNAEFLARVSVHGVDAHYVLTGLRSFDPCATTHDQPAATLAARLVQERKRLDLTLGQLADKAGVDRLALLKFEEGEFSPDAKALQQLHAVGVDVGYVLLSLRAGAAGGEAGTAASVSSDTQQLLQHYQKAPEEAQAALRTLAAMAARG